MPLAKHVLRIPSIYIRLQGYHIKKERSRVWGKWKRRRRCRLFQRVQHRLLSEGFSLGKVWEDWEIGRFWNIKGGDYIVRLWLTPQNGFEGRKRDRRRRRKRRGWRRKGEERGQERKEPRITGKKGGREGKEKEKKGEDKAAVLGALGRRLWAHKMMESLQEPKMFSMGFLETQSFLSHLPLIQTITQTID